MCLNGNKVDDAGDGAYGTWENYLPTCLSAKKRAQRNEDSYEVLRCSEKKGALKQCSQQSTDFSSGTFKGIMLNFGKRHEDFEWIVYKIALLEETSQSPEKTAKPDGDWAMV